MSFWPDMMGQGFSFVDVRTSGDCWLLENQTAVATDSVLVEIVAEP